MNIAKLTHNFLRIGFVPTVTDVFGQAINKNREKLSKLISDKSRQVMQSELAQKMRVAKHYYTVEMSPPSGNDMQGIRQDIALIQEFIKNRCFMFLTVKQAWLLILVCTEIGLWFFMGETIGKMHIVGYKV